MANTYTDEQGLTFDKDTGELMVDVVKSQPDITNVEVDKDTLDMTNLALDNVTKFLATYKNPKDWVLDEKEARLARMLKSAEPEKSSAVGSLGYSAGELLRTTYALPRKVISAGAMFKAGLEDVFFPNAEQSALERWADNYGKIDAQRDRTREELVAQEVGYQDWYNVGTAAMAMARDLALTGGFAKLGAYVAGKRAVNKLADRYVGKEVASRYIGKTTAKGAEKAGGATIAGSVFAQELGEGTTQDINEYIAKTGDYDLKYYEPGVDFAVNVGVGALSAIIEKGLGVERFVPRLIARGYGDKIPGLMQVLARGGEGLIGEAAEEGLQDTIGQFGEMIKGYRDWWDFDWDRILTSMTIGGALGGAAGSGLYYINRRVAISKLTALGVDKNTAADLVDTMASREINKTLNNLSAVTELQTHSGQAYDKLKAGIKSALELQGWSERIIDSKTGEPMDIDEYVDALARNFVITPAIKEAYMSGLSIDTFLDIAQFGVFNNVLALKPLGSLQEIQAKIDQQNAIIKRQQELKKTGAGNDTLLKEARIKKAVLQQAYTHKKLNQEIQKVNIEESKTPEITKEIDNATKDVETLKNTSTQADFNSGLSDNLTTNEKVKRFGNAVIKRIFGKDKTGFDAVMTLPQYTNAKLGIINSANRIFEFAKAHRTYGINTDLRNALKKLETITKDNFVESITVPNLEGNDVIAENAFLYHFLFSDSNTISAYIDAYLERAEASISGKTGTSLSKKDLVGQAFKATDNLMQVQAESAGIEYTSIYNKDDSLADVNVGAVFASYQNQFIADTQTPGIEFQDKVFKIADENARLNDIYPAYEGETIEVDGKERTVYNSNSDRIAKSKEALTNFWKWFGDSKVVDEQGRPLVVYHGTDVRFDTFDIEKSNNGVYGKGFYFAYDERIPKGHGGIIMPVYLKVEHPFMASGKTTVKQIRENLNSQKYDGFLSSDEVFVKKNTQIKPIYNRRTFSEKTGNIYYQGKQANGFYDPELDLIVLGKNFNTMTLPHEFAHYWLNTLFNVYKRVQSGDLKVKPEWISHVKALFNMVGVANTQENLTRGQQEKFARMTESYLTGIGVSKEMNQTFTEYFKWGSQKYKSILQLGYLDDQGKIQYPFLDQKAVDFFNRWYENASLPSLPTSPERQRFMNVTGDDNKIQQVSIKEMNDREKEFAQDAEEQNKTDARLYTTLDENMPNNIKPTADAQKVVINERSNFLKESQAQQVQVAEEPKRRWFERKSRATETQMAQEYIEQNPEHAKEVIFGDPEFVPNNTGIDRSTLINTYMAMNNITPEHEDWARLHTNIAINQSLAGTQLALSNDKSYGTYLDALREIENVLEMKAATNYAGSKVGAVERFNTDIQRFLDKELPAIFATEPNSKERETALQMLFEKARTTFSGNTTGTFLNQVDLDYAKAQRTKNEVFMRWATNQIKKDAGAKLNNEQQAKLLQISAKAQQALVDIDNQDPAKAVAAAQELRNWQLEKQKMMGVSPQKFSLFGDYAPRAMLASFNTLVVANIPSTAINTAVVNMVKTGLFGKNKVSKNLIDAEISRIKAIYGATAMNLAQMEKPTSPSLLHGEKYSAAGQKWYDPYTILGKEDNFFRVPTFVNTLAQIASTDAKATGRNADEVFKQYIALNNQTDEAKLARKQALAVANMAVFTQNGALANCLNHIRSELNKVFRLVLGLEPKGFGLGNLLAPFLTTGANIAEMGIRGAIAPITTISSLVNSWRTGKAIDPLKKLALRMDWTYFTLSAVSMVLLAALTSDDDDFYTDPYITGRKYSPDKPYDSINLGGVWLDLDFFGPFSIPMRTAAKVIQAWKTDNGIGESIAKGYLESGKTVFGDVPLVESIVNNQFNWAVKKPGAWATSYLYTQANKLIPAQIKPVSRAISRGAGVEFDVSDTTLGRKFNRNYGFDGAELTTQDLVELFTIKLQLDESVNKTIAN